jgi:hypothetical protein
MDISKKARVIAFYLPQFHPISENDKWWGKGFTEWTNVGKAKPLFKGHYQPRVPADLGYYDLRMPEIREAQAQMAREAGIEGFMYWHYWFGNGKRLLEEPFCDVLTSGKPNFPFCLGWANESWKAKSWNSNSRDKILIEQLYPGVHDYEQHFFAVLTAFKDNRYITINGKPIFLIYQPFQIPSIKEFIQQWNYLAKSNGLLGIYFIARIEVHRFSDYNYLIENGVDAITMDRISAVEINMPKIIRNPLRYLRKLFNKPLIIPYKKASRHFTNKKQDILPNVFPSIIPNWDHSPRSGTRATILHESTPDLFERHVERTLEAIKNKPEQLKVVFLKSWNEWGEGNYIEPDVKFGKLYLEKLRNCINRNSQEA